MNDSENDESSTKNENQTTNTNNDNDDTNVNNNDNDENEREIGEIVYNAKWSGYLGIMLSSLVNFASAADVSVENITSITIQIKGEDFAAIFGAVSFFIALLILVFDRINVLQNKFDFKEVYDGKLEGAVLMFLVIWWIVGVSIMTKAGGVAYNVLNTYFSCWYTLGMAVWTLNRWSAAKDIISIHELTRLSETLKFWYILFFASVVEMGSAADVFTRLNGENIMDVATEGKKEYSIAVGAVSTVLAAISILAHYKLICCCKLKPGGIFEITVGVILCIWWVLAVAILTTDEQIASTIQGVAGYPGSNLYLSLWLGLYGSVKICLQWKAVHAMKQLSKVTMQRIENRNRNQLNDDDIEY
jgi:hypothetical protein